MHCMYWVHVSFTCFILGHMFHDGTFVQFKVFQKHGSSLVLASVCALRMLSDILSPHFHSVIALHVTLECDFFFFLIQICQWKCSRCFSEVSAAEGIV